MICTPISDLDEALRHGVLAEKRVHDVFDFVRHSHAAWNATDAAEESGVPLHELTPLRMRLLRLAIVDWLPRATLHAKTLRTLAERGAWLRSLAACVRIGAGWYERSLANGAITPDGPARDVLDAWQSEIERLERAARQAVAS